MDNREQLLIPLDQVCVTVSADTALVEYYRARVARGDLRRRLKIVQNTDGLYEVQTTEDAAWVEACREAGLTCIPARLVKAAGPNLMQSVLARLDDTAAALSQRKLAQELGVSRSTIRRALAVSPVAISRCALQVWDGPVLSPRSPLTAASVDLIASCAPDLPPTAYAPDLAHLLSERGILWLVFEADQWQELYAWCAALGAAGLTFRRLATWVITATRNQRNPRLAGYRLLLSFGKANTAPLEDRGQVYPGWTGPRALAEADPAQRIIPVWLWKRWLAEQPSGQVVLDPFATSPTLFDAVRSQPQPREAWACPVDETARSLLHHYVDHQT
jgi:hypothetical protein